MNIVSLRRTTRILPLVLLAILTLPLIAIAGPGEEANAVIDCWSAAYSSNDPDAVTKNYARMRFSSEPKAPFYRRAPRSRLISLI